MQTEISHLRDFLFLSSSTQFQVVSLSPKSNFPISRDKSTSSVACSLHQNFLAVSMLSCFHFTGRCALDVCRIVS